MKTKKERPQFFAMYKDFNSGKIESVDVLSVVFNEILTTKGTINKRFFFTLDNTWHRVEIRTKEQFRKFIERELRYHFWAKCEWEFIAIDWPHRDTISDSRPIKIDVFDQVEPNIPLITDIAWNYMEPIIAKVIEKEKKKVEHGK